VKQELKNYLKKAGRYPLTIILVLYLVICVFGCKRSYVYQDINLSDLRSKTNFVGRIETLTVFTNFAGIGNLVTIGIVARERSASPSETRVFSDDFVAFAKSLQAGQNYEFPKVLMEFENRLGRELKDVRVKPRVRK
jgi:hypothetical protein